ncbi:LIS1 homology motif [Arabidopsis suecica]|uniref:LIS1 homology motif n=1 Tax=Arabidopsis suecica TaxID=45249 RepID=A0A8T2AD40_ARASU|nr:LIS1 homology motif [Arabidopsis suecica]
MILDEKNRKNLVFLILQFFDEEGYEESLHLLEQDSRVFFDFSYFSNAILNGNFKEADDYLLAFTRPEANTYSRKMFFDLFKRKLSEAPDRSGGSEAVNIFSKDLRRIPVLKDDSFDDLVEVIAVDDMRISEETCCVDKAPGRAKLCVDLHKLAESNPCLCDKLEFPSLNKSALLSLISLICPNCSGRNGGLKEDLICLILQFLYEAKYKNTLHKLEQETKVFFNLNYLAEVMKLGEYGKAEEYLGAFTDSKDNKYSKAMFLEIQKLICLQSTEWEVATPSGSLDNMSPKIKLHASVAMLAKKNPVLKDKLKFPSMEKSRLLTLMKQTMDWWTSSTCNSSSSLENVPVVSYLCGTPSSLRKKFNKTGPRKKVVNCKPNEINDPSQCNALVLPDYCSEERIARLTYSPSGDYILALAEDAAHNLWTWSSSQNEFCKYTPRILKENVFPKPRLHQPQSGKTMKNEMAASVQNSTSCFAIKGSYLFSTSGGKIAVFDLKSFEKVASFGSPTPMATYFIFIPGDLLAVGLDDGSIYIHCLSSRKVKEKLEGHDQKITCLAFSRCFNVLVSSDSDGKLCLWSTKSWVKLTSKNSTRKFCTQSNHESTSLVTHLQFDPYQIELLVVHEGWIGIYEGRTLDCRLQWVPDESDTSITSATYSSDGEIIYVGFRSGFIKIVDSRTFMTVCRINLTSFTQPSPNSIRLEVYPTVVAAHPSHPSQISAGLSNGKVIVLQPLWSGGWGEAAPLDDNGGYSNDSDHSY